MTARLIENLPIEDYFRIEAESATGLKNLLISPYCYQYRKEHDRPDKRELRIGRATHTAVLEPAKFSAGYVVYPGKVRNGKEWDAFKLEHESRGLTILSRTEYDNALTIAAAVRANARAAELLDEDGRAEVSVVWKHERTGLTLKSRPDWLCSALVDLKTGREVDSHMFTNASARLKYHVQLAMYQAALLTLGMPPRPAKIIAAQNHEPYDVAVYRFTDRALLEGERLYETALDKLARCRDEGRWPGVDAGEELELDLPGWAVAVEDEDDGEWKMEVA